MEKKNISIGWIIVIIIISLIFMGISKVSEKVNNFKNTFSLLNDKSLNIISSSENKDLESIIKSYAKEKGYNVNIEYDGTIDVMQKLNTNSKDYDAVWVSNSIWLYMLNSDVKVTNSKYTSINPVIFAITKSKAKQLGLVGKDVYLKDIVSAISSGKLKFSMSNPTSTNSGASAYLGFLSTLAGNPEVLSKDDLKNEKLEKDLKDLFSGLERSSGSEDFLEELFLKGDYESVVTYESSIININQKLKSEGKEELYAIYPVDGVSISDSPFAYIDNGNEEKKEIFEDIQSYILGKNGQELLQQKGRRTWYGGINKNVDKTLFNPDLGIDTTKYISPIKYPSTDVIKYALNLYQTEFRKPVHVVFCLDYSGSMYGKGYEELTNAMEYILTDEAANDFIQFTSKDKVDVIPFGSKVIDIWSTNDGSNTKNILQKIKDEEPSGSTALYPATMEALKLLNKEDNNKYNLSIILMTDGKANVGSYYNLANIYRSLGKDIPIYSIMFGSASSDELEEIATLSNAKVFDGKEDLVKAFKEVRGYN